MARPGAVAGGPQHGDVVEGARARAAARFSHRRRGGVARRLGDPKAALAARLRAAPQCMITTRAKQRGVSASPKRPSPPACWQPENQSLKWSYRA